MSRAVLILANGNVRERAVDWIKRAPEGTRVEFKGPKRTLDQNALMWAMLGDIAEQKKHLGRSYNTDQWKCIFLHALGRETQFIPALAGKDFIPYGQRSSDLSKEEMSELIDFMHAWGTENGVQFHAPEEVAA